MLANINALLVKDLMFGLGSVKARSDFTKQALKHKFESIMEQAKQADRLILVGKIADTQSLTDLAELVEAFKALGKPPLYCCGFEKDLRNSALRLLESTGVIEVIMPGQSIMEGDAEITNMMTLTEEPVDIGDGLTLGLKQSITSVPQNGCYLEVSTLSGVVRREEGSKSAVYQVMAVDGEWLIEEELLEVPKAQFITVKERQNIDLAWLEQDQKSGNEAFGVTIKEKVGDMIRSLPIKDSCREILLTMNEEVVV